MSEINQLRNLKNRPKKTIKINFFRKNLFQIKILNIKMSYFYGVSNIVLNVVDLFF